MHTNRTSTEIFLKLDDISKQNKIGMKLDDSIDLGVLLI